MQKIKFDFILSVVLISLIGFGITLNFSASSALSLAVYGRLDYFLNKQIMFIFIGIFVMLTVAKIPYQRFRKHIYAVNAAALACLMLSYVPAFQVSANGAERWVNVFGITFQPSEIAKIAIVFTLAHMIDNRKKNGKLNSFADMRNGAPAVLGYLAVYAGLILMQKHLSAAGVVLLVALSLLLIGGLKKIYFGALGAAAVAVAVGAVLLEPYRLKRIVGFLNPEQNPLKEGYQIIQSWYGLGSGKWFGLGLGMSRQKFTWLPENHTDFIVGVIGEEIGYIGIMVLIILFLCFLLRGLTLASQSPDFFGMMVVSGIALMIFYQFAINMAVVSGLMPVTGMPLPFISYGGSSTVILFLGIGLIFNVASQNESAETKKI